MTKIAFHFLDQPDNRHNGNRFCLIFYQQCFLKKNRKRMDYRSGYISGLMSAVLWLHCTKVISASDIITISPCGWMCDGHMFYLLTIYMLYREKNYYKIRRIRDSSIPLSFVFTTHQITHFTKSRHFFFRPLDILSGQPSPWVTGGPLDWSNDFCLFRTVLMSSALWCTFYTYLDTPTLQAAFPRPYNDVKTDCLWI